MFRAWWTAAADAESLVQQVEAHINEFAEDVISVNYQITDQHCVLVVYRAIDTAGTAAEDAAVAQAEEIIEAQA